MSTPLAIVPDFNLRQALKTARQSAIGPTHTVLDALLLDTKHSAAQLRQLLQDQGGVRVVLNQDEATSLPDHSHATALRALGFVPLQMTPADGNGLHLAAADPWDADLASQACALLQATPTFVAAPAVLLRQWMGEAATSARSDAAIPFVQASGAVVTFVNGALKAAFEGGASDVHFEYSRAGIAVRLRQDGVMTDYAKLAGTDRADEVISRIKVLAQLDITERRVPQDGRFRFDFESGSIDLRVSIMPSVFGEDAVLRLLDKAQLRATQAVSLDLLGFDEDSAGGIRELAELPHGMMLVTGPTGSGKTTTVYAILSEVNSGQEKIVTIEDPVEYELPGVLQIPVNERKNLTFAKGLRSILRHDPDRILVGEIRDAETAEIAVQSALTGHQVFTTVHANSIFDVTGRFRHFGLDMFGFMSALNGVIVQRLVRRLCPHCTGSRAPTEREARWLHTVGRTMTALPRPMGCEQCRQTGYRGRLVIAEVHRIGDEFRDLVTGNAPVSQLREYVERTGVKSLGAQAARLIAAGLTSAEEVKRVVGWY